MTDIGPETVARYIAYTETGYDVSIRPAHDGPLVRFSDYEALAARLAEVEAERGTDWYQRAKNSAEMAQGWEREAREWKARAEAAEAEVARLKTAQGAAGVCPHPESYDRGECCGGYCTMPGVDGEQT